MLELYLFNLLDFSKPLEKSNKYILFNIRAIKLYILKVKPSSSRKPMTHSVAEYKKSSSLLTKFAHLGFKFFGREVVGVLAFRSQGLR